MKVLTFDIEDRIKWIGYYQIAGGIIGFIRTIPVLVSIRELSGLMLLMFAIAFSLYAFSIICGNQLRKLNLKGLNTSVVNQVLQIFSITIFGIGFNYSSGIRAYFGIDLTNNMVPDFAFGFSSWGLKFIPSNNSEVSFLINLIPLIVIYYINQVQRDINERQLFLTELQKGQ